MANVGLTEGLPGIMGGVDPQAGDGVRGRSPPEKLLVKVGFGKFSLKEVYTNF